MSRKQKKPARVLPMKKVTKKGVDNQPPAVVGEAVPTVDALKKSLASLDKSVDTAPIPGVGSSQLPITGERGAEQLKEKKMKLTLSGTSKNGKASFYKGAALTIRISNAVFPAKTAPESIEVADGVFSPAKAPKVKLSAEERKAARASKPKPTLAERAAAARKRADALAAKAAAEGSQPSM